MRSYRGAVACRNKWYDKLDPNIRREPFSAEEDELALALARRLPKRHWSEISQCMDGRTDSMVMKRIFSLTGRFFFLTIHRVSSFLNIYIHFTFLHSYLYIYNKE